MIPVAVTVAFIMFLILISLVPNLLPLMIQKFRFRRIPREELINDDHDGDQDSEDVMHLELPQGNVILTGDCIWQDVANRKVGLTIFIWLDLYLFHML